VDPSIIWAILVNHLPLLKDEVERMMVDWISINDLRFQDEDEDEDEDEESQILPYQSINLQSNNRIIG
jgi:hypothetical protein